MLFKNCFFLALFSLVLVSCAESKNSRFRDTSHLEKPPEMEIAETAKEVVAEEDKEISSTGLGDEYVSYSDSAEKPMMKIKKLFDRSWILVEQALKLSKIEITDKNRDQGFFYVNFDPNAEESNDNVTFLFFEDEYDAAAYKLIVEWNETATEVTTELVNRVNTDLPDEEDMEDFEGSVVDGGAKLLKKLYKTIRDDLPLD
jgi:outer membrane protein assembly factor BamC